MKMPQFPSRFWIECGWQDFAAADMSNVIAVLPVAAVEQTWAASAGGC